MSAPRSKFGRYLRTQRQARDWSLRNMEAESGIHYSLLAQLEAGTRKPTADVIQRVAKTFRVSREEVAAIANEGLPRLSTYLRAKYDLPDDAIAELETHFKQVSKRSRT